MCMCVCPYIGGMPPMYLVRQISSVECSHFVRKVTIYFGRIVGRTMYTVHACAQWTYVHGRGAAKWGDRGYASPHFKI